MEKEKNIAQNPETKNENEFSTVEQCKQHIENLERHIADLEKELDKAKEHCKLYQGLYNRADGKYTFLMGLVKLTASTSILEIVKKLNATYDLNGNF